MPRNGRAAFLCEGYKRLAGTTLRGVNKDHMPSHQGASDSYVQKCVQIGSRKALLLAIPSSRTYADPRTWSLQHSSAANASRTERIVSYFLMQQPLGTFTPPDLLGGTLGLALGCSKS